VYRKKRHWEENRWLDSVEAGSNDGRTIEKGRVVGMKKDKLREATGKPRKAAPTEAINRDMGYMKKQRKGASLVKMDERSDFGFLFLSFYEWV